MHVMGWAELPEDQIPPEEYWHSPEMVDDWFKAVKRRTADRRKGVESIEEPDDDDGYVDDEVAALRG